jgi:hypothetical protein
VDTVKGNVIPAEAGIQRPHTQILLESLMAFVPLPLAQIARLKIIHGAAQIMAQEGRDDSGTNGGVGTQAVVLAFWMGTPERSREPVRKALEQMGLWQYVATASRV